MNSLFEKNTYQAMVDRVHQLQPSTASKWGKMNVAQMLTHCARTYAVPLSTTTMPRLFMGRLIAWLFKPTMYNEKPWKQNLPTSPEFVVKEDKNFDVEKANLLDLMQKFYDKGEAGIGDKVHPFFGKFTASQWGITMYKHLDHHLQQFGV